MEENKTSLPTGDTAGAHLGTAGKWAKFIAVVNFVCLALGIVGMLFGLLAMGAAGTSFPGMPAAFGMWYFTLMLCLMALMFIPTLYLYRFGEKALAAARGDDEAAMSHSLANLSRYFRFTGIYLIVAFALCVVAIIFTVIVGIGAAAAGIM